MRRLITFASLMGVFALLVAACGGAAVPDENGELRIALKEFEFSPSSIELTPGETVTLILVNEGEKEHEFMVGRTVVFTEAGEPNGFEHDFFEGIDVQVEPPGALEMEMAGDEMAGDEMAGDEMAGDEMATEGEHGHAGFMVAREPGEEARITFTVPADKGGEWQIGCFEEDGSHWDDGMQGTLTVVTG